MLLQIIVVVLGLSTCLGKMPYTNQIPNGHSVPNPCIPGTLWAGVGHTSPAGGGNKNLFGWAFADHGHTWTAALCGEDTDGDGMTNGEELGDPGCVWTVGDTPTHAATHHPGICDPVTLTECMHKNSDWEIDCYLAMY
ncbi:temptin-like [Pecten maximus]|uniref:temptin-like n=1 Tax=Pecten maximus TaxID=6579 RepID=UPI00145825D8|nr:temptin-like [Pecten maximus]